MGDSGVWYLAGLPLALLLLSACGGGSSPTSVPFTPTPSQAPSATPSPAPSPTPAHTATPVPTPTFSPGRVILPTVAIPTVTPVTTPVDPTEELMNTIGSRVSVIRQIFALTPVEREIIDREELKIRLREDLEENRERTDAIEALYVTMGVMDRETDLHELLIGILGEDVLGFFDAEEKKLFVVKDAPEFGPVETVTYSHEFAHSLQQERFDIHAISERLRDRMDEFRAFRALVEGDASIAELFYTFQYMSEDERAEAIAAARNRAPSPIQTAPHLLRRTIRFPYIEGAQFVASLYLSINAWDVVNGAFEQLPQSTEQILHPEKYLLGEAAVDVTLPDLSAALGDAWTLVRQDTLGEFLILAYLEVEVSPEEASVAAQGWGGDAYLLFRGPAGEDLLVSSATWDTEDDAHEFFNTFVEFTELRTGGEWEVLSEEGRLTRIMNLADQTIYIDQGGPETTLIFAPDLETLGIARSALRNR